MPTLATSLALFAVTVLSYGALAQQRPLWGQFGGDARHSGRSELLGPHSAPTVLWTAEEAVVAAALLVCANGDVVFGGAKGTVTILDGETGARKARTQLRPLEQYTLAATTALSEDGAALYVGLSNLRGSMQPGPVLVALDTATLARVL